MSRVITRTLEFNAEIERVWKALTDPNELAKWFPDRADFDPRPGSLGWVEWDSHGRFPLRVEAIEPPHHLSWSWSHGPGLAFDEEKSTLVEWTLTEREEGGTRLELRESGFDSEKSYRENQGGWTSELGELADLLEGPRAVFSSNSEVALHVADLDRAEAFYVGVLGGRLVNKTESSLEIDSGALTLYVNRDEDTQRSFIPSFDVPDGARAALQLQVAGCEVEQCASGGRYFRDPFGLVFDIVERAAQTADIA